MSQLRLFEAFGIEIEYMIVDASSLNVRPISDELLKALCGAYEQEVEIGPVAWSNELALHVAEIKTNGPAPTLAGLAATFQEHIADVNRSLGAFDARLLPTAMHPWMNPDKELHLWPHGDDEIYHAFHRIFDCRGHGWANLQSVHINLPFCGDDEFGRLHAAIRMVLPLIPALAASSPITDGKRTPHLDNRLDVYRSNAKRVPSVAGQVIPERVFTRADYETKLLQPIYRDLEPLDPEGILQHEWVNSRGCIARFDRMAIEIRLVDVQECPAADIAIAAAITGVVRALVDQKLSDYEDQCWWSEGDLATLLQKTIRDADEATIDNERYLKTLGCDAKSMAAGALWQHLIEATLALDRAYPEWQPALQRIADAGCLSRRIVAATGPQPDRHQLHDVYGRLADCLKYGQLF